MGKIKRQILYAEEPFWQRAWRLRHSAVLLILLMASLSYAEDLPRSGKEPVVQPNEIQHGFAQFDSPPDFFDDDAPTETSAPYDTYSDSPELPTMDHKPRGLFESLAFAESVEEDRTIRRGHILVPVNATETFSPATRAVHLVFTVHTHLAPYQVIGRLFPEQVPNLDPSTWIDEDRADLALEDESGYLKFFPPEGTWLPGQYRVDVYVGYMVSTMNKMGTMRFVIRHENSVSRPESTPAMSSE